MTSPIHKKTFPLHRDDGAYHPHPQALEDCWKFGQEIDTVREAMPTRLEPRMPVARPFNRMYAKWNNPIALYYVVDAMARARRGTYIRSKYISDELNKTAPMYFWRPASVGRMLSGLFETQAEHYGFAEGNDMLPLGKARDARGPYYVIDPFGGIEGAMWLVKIRDYLGGLIPDIMFAEQNGNFDKSHWSDGEFTPRTPADLYFDMLPGAVRTVELAKAGMDPTHLHGAYLDSGRERLHSAF